MSSLARHLAPYLRLLNKRPTYKRVEENGGQQIRETKSFKAIEPFLLRSMKRGVYDTYLLKRGESPERMALLDFTPKQLHKIFSQYSLSTIRRNLRKFIIKHGLKLQKTWTNRRWNTEAPFYYGPEIARKFMRMISAVFNQAAYKLKGLAMKKFKNDTLPKKIRKIKKKNLRFGRNRRDYDPPIIFFNCVSGRDTKMSTAIGLSRGSSHMIVTRNGREIKEIRYDQIDMRGKNPLEKAFPKWKFKRRPPIKGESTRIMPQEENHNYSLRPSAIPEKEGPKATTKEVSSFAKNMLRILANKKEVEPSSQGCLFRGGTL